MDNESILWKEIYEILTWGLKEKDGTPQNRLNRLVKEPFPHFSNKIDESTCTVKEKLLSFKEITKLTPWHERANPNQLDGKIVLFSHSNKIAVIDGSNRVNLNIKTNKRESMTALIMKFRKGVSP